ncbi:hypothetical protein [Mycolicibacterium neworleansense]|uniref:Uncharacterized protein n=1 Tax=Mycolicibacterium neworleansense TaxID=146018 RepID=A0A0H5RM26_9MYCO|nr:hypothetical protein [Mycolicibacterium neworleansense]MCV7363853.1 hypothetical protein [Mycolicibacterium neworleansense]CRZ14806.1 hypothetical protein BN2156_01662 [Mycolicibacterium neworleansense]
MIADLEKRLADVLGGRLTAPLAGRVFVTPGPADTNQIAVLVGAVHAEVLAEKFGAGRRPEQVPGADDPRRVVRLRCAMRIEVRPADNGTRAQTAAALDALLYELDSRELRTASALTAPGDPGFVLDCLLPESVAVIPGEPDSLPVVEVRADGWFWPPNAPGVTGVEITAALVRTAMLPVALQPWPLLIRAGDPVVPLTIRVGAAGTSRLTEDPPTVSPFGELAVRVVDAGGRPGAGSLSGGAVGPDGTRLITVADDAAEFRYEPPAAPADDQLVVYVAHDGASPSVGIELARFPLAVTG